MLAASSDMLDWMTWTLVRVVLSLMVQLYSSNTCTAQPNSRTAVPDVELEYGISIVVQNFSTGGSCTQRLIIRSY